MSLCLSCKFGNKCPYMDGVNDFIHIMVNEDDLFQKLHDHVDKFNRKVEHKYKFAGPLTDRGIELGLEISHCEGFQRLCL